MKIAILGAKGSGKSWLAKALSQAFDEMSTDATPALAVLESASPVAVAPVDLILLIGLDLPLAASEVASGPQDLREAQDAQLRADLARGGAVFHVVYGTGAARLANALAAIRRMTAPDLEADCEYSTKEKSLFSSYDPKKWQWNCDKCSDADCEHRLFTLLAQSTATRLPIKD